MDIEKIREIYGDSVIDLINQNIDDISINIKYLKELGFTDAEDIFERYVYIFIEDNDIFKDKYFKLEENKICKTITAHMKFDCNMYIHPWESRGLSPREAARTISLLSILADSTYLVRFSFISIVFLSKNE